MSSNSFSHLQEEPEHIILVCNEHESMTDIGKNHLAGTGNFLVFNRVSLKALQHLEKEVGNISPLYLVEESCPLESELENYLNSKSSEGISFSFDRSDLPQLGEHLSGLMKEGKTVVFMPGRITSIKGSISHVPDYILDAIADINLPVNPVFVGFYGNGIMDAELATDANAAEVFVRILPQLERGKEMAARIASTWLEASADKFASLPQLKGSLAIEVLEGMKKHPNARLIDGIDDSSLTYSKLLGVAIAFSKRLKQMTSLRRIGIILPPGKGATIANIACIFAGKVPVNINYSNSEAAFQSAVRQSRVEQFITADTFMRKLQGFPWPPRRDLIFMELEMKNISRAIVRWVFFSKFLSSKMLIKLLKLNEISNEDEASLLFTSGSSSEPKGVPLTQKNILGNIAQSASRITLTPESRLLSSLPVFHGFGMTIGLWLPLISGNDFVTYPSPLESKRLGELIKIYKTELVVSTPTFLRGFMKRCSPDTFKFVTYLIVGAEKLPMDLASAFASRFGIEPCEGYGLTEASPVCSVNFQNPEIQPGASFVPGIKRGSVGSLLPGIAVRITSPHDGSELPITHKGMIWLKGVNIFAGYLNNKKANDDVFEKGWFKTGDIGCADTQGFLRIEGRLARFSKIAGEMVSHEAVEQALMKALSIDPGDEEKHIAIVSIPDGQRGEAMALLSTMISNPEFIHQEQMTIRYKIMDQGLPALWCPKEIIPISSIPCLPTGKLDLAKCRAIAFDWLRMRNQER